MIFLQTLQAITNFVLFLPLAAVFTFPQNAKIFYAFLYIFVTLHT